MNKIKRISNESLVWILGFAGLISAADNWVISPLLPTMGKSFSITIPLAGLVLTAYMLPYGIMQPVYGFMGDRIGKVKVLTYLLCGLIVGTFACAVSPFFWSLCLFRVITGFFAAGIIALSLGLIGDQVDSSESQVCVGKFMGIVFLGQGGQWRFTGKLCQLARYICNFLIGCNVFCHIIKKTSKKSLCESC